MHPLTSSTLPNLVRLLSGYGFDRRYTLRVLYIIAVCLLRQPFQFMDFLRFRERIRTQAIEPDPIFIIGHWRSGTTHLQNLISQDPQFGRVTLLQASSPHDFLTLHTAGRNLLRSMLPERRIMDNVRLSPDMPWEEELAMVSYCLYSFYHVSFFPRCIEQIFAQAVLFNNSQTDVENWRRHYIHFLKKAQSTQPGRRLILKNPANTARIQHLRQIFPAARFIHIHRHPYEVFTSTMHLYSKVQSAWRLQQTDQEQLRRHVIASYSELMHAYFEQSRQLDRNHLFELSYDDLEHNPLEMLKSLYGQLGLDGYADAKPRFQRYLEQERNYAKNQYSISEADKRVIYQNWRETFSQYGYTN